MFDAAENGNELASERGGIFSRLGTMSNYAGAA
jgi:hypothetical protein